MKIEILDGTTKNPGVFTVFKLCNGFNMTMSEFFKTDEFKDLQTDIS